MKAIAITLLFSSLLSWGQSSIKNDLEAAQKRLISQREKYESTQITLSERLTELQNEVLQKRRQADIARRSVSDQQAYANTVESKALQSKSEADNLSGALRTYGTQLITRQLPGTAQDSRLDALFTDPKEEETGLVKRLEVIEVGLDRIDSAFGGSVQPAQASTEDAEIITGKVVSFGPARWFSNESGSVAGAYELEKSGKVATVDLNSSAEAVALLKGDEAKVNIDITGGKAKALSELRNTPLSLVKKGGAWVYPILLIAFISLGCVIYKGMQLLMVKDLKESWINEVCSKINGGNTAEASGFAAATNHPARKVIPNTVDAISSKLSVAEEVLYERLMPVRQDLRHLLGFISVTAAVAPLLGLLGTVSGLIKTFSVIAVEGTGEAQSISGGISEALITTLFGLIVAIPSFMLHAVLIRKAKGIEQNIERVGLAILNHVRRQQLN